MGCSLIAAAASILKVIVMSQPGSQSEVKGMRIMPSQHTPLGFKDYLMLGATVNWCLQKETVFLSWLKAETSEK